MRKADLVNRIADKTGIAKVDVLVSIEALFKEIRDSLKNDENVYVRGFGSFIIKKRAKKIGRNMKLKYESTASQKLLSQRFIEHISDLN